MPSSPSILYYTSAALTAISVPGHIQFGLKALDPAIDQIPNTTQNDVGKASATAAWDMMNSMLATLGKSS